MPRKSTAQEDLPATAIIASGGGKRYKPKAQGKDTENELRKSRLGEKLKKRLSVKYTYQQPSTFDNAPPVPSLPSTHIPNEKQALQPEDARESLFEDIDENRVSDVDIINKEWLQQPDFDAQACRYDYAFQLNV